MCALSLNIQLARPVFSIKVAEHEDKLEVQRHFSCKLHGIRLGIFLF